MASSPVASAASAANPIPSLETIFAGFSRPAVENFVSLALDWLDKRDGDPDLESNQDEGEPDFQFNAIDWAGGAGCPISDPGGGYDGDEEPDESEDLRPIADTLAAKQHLDRIRRDRAMKIPAGPARYSFATWRLREWPAVPTKASLLRRKRGIPKRPRG